MKTLGRRRLAQPAGGSIVAGEPGDSDVRLGCPSRGAELADLLGDALRRLSCRDFTRRDDQCGTPQRRQRLAPGTSGQQAR